MKKNNLLHSILMLGLVFSISCKGPAGDTGPVGPAGAKGDVGAAGANGASGAQGVAGAAGATGTKGDPGAMGQASVVYSDWITPTWAYTGYNDQVDYFTMKNTAMPLLTKEAIDKGVIAVYFKASTFNYNRDIDEYEPKDVITASYSNFLYKIPDRKTTKNWDYANGYASFDQTFGENYIQISGGYYKNGYDATGTKYGIIPEFVGKSFSFFNDLIKNKVQYRVVVINGSVKGRLGNLDLKNYYEVKKAFNIKD
jgi:Collagen triple helix repeat (20 copies)